MSFDGEGKEQELTKDDIGVPQWTSKTDTMLLCSAGPIALNAHEGFNVN